MTAYLFNNKMIQRYARASVVHGRIRLEHYDVWHSKLDDLHVSTWGVVCMECELSEQSSLIRGYRKHITG